MKKLFLFVAAIVVAISAIASDQFYVIMKDGSAESFPSDKVDSITFDDPQIANAKGFNDLMSEIEKLKNEIEVLKSNGGGNAFGSIDGYEYVDLGLPSGTKWATMNVGASKNNDYGTYFAWGEIAPAPSNIYSSANCKAYNKSNSSLQTSGVVDVMGNLTYDYDAATQNWGGKWRMPTKAEFDELLENCIWKWTSIGGVNGYKVSSYVFGNANWIFLPVAGAIYGTSSDGEGSYGSYWSSTVFEGGNSRAYGLYFDSSSKYTLYDYLRDSGRTVRPVTE